MFKLIAASMLIAFAFALASAGRGEATDPLHKALTIGTIR